MFHPRKSDNLRLLHLPLRSKNKTKEKNAQKLIIMTLESNKSTRRFRNISF